MMVQLGFWGYGLGFKPHSQASDAACTSFEKGQDLIDIHGLADAKSMAACGQLQQNSDIQVLDLHKRHVQKLQ
jgi:hypothetical protein